MKAYKVLSGTLFSVFVGQFHSPVKYKEYEWVEPLEGHGPLAVFYDLDAAVEFTRYFPRSLIYHCDYKPSEEKMFWYRKSIGGRRVINHRCDGFPRGTIFADRVMITQLAI